MTEEIKNEKLDEEVTNETTESKVSEEVDETKEVVEENSSDDKKIEELTDRLKRLMAEFENYRKRSDKEKKEMFDNGMSSLILKILPVVDNFERGLLTVEEKEDPFYKGIEQVYKQMIEVLTSVGVESIDALDKEFNPEFHNAIMHDEDDSDRVNIVVEEFQKGYKYKEKVIRYSMVKVLN